jgi:hypothetical protein
MINTQVGPIDTQGNTYVSQYTDYQLSETELKTQLTRRDTQMAIALNFKTNGIYDQGEVQTGEQFFGTPGNIQKKRLSFRKVFSFGTLAPGDTLTPPISHGITGITSGTNIYGTAVTADDFRPIPYASATDVLKQIEVNVTATQINIINGANAPAITSGIIVLEYLKN